MKSEEYEALQNRINPKILFLNFDCVNKIMMIDIYTTLWHCLLEWINEKEGAVDCRFLANLKTIPDTDLYTDILFFWCHVKWILFL